MSKGPQEVITPPSHKNEIEPITALDKIFNKTQILLINRKWAWAIKKIFNISISGTDQSACTISQKEHRQGRKCSAWIGAVFSRQITCILHKQLAVCKTPHGQSGITGGPLGSLSFLSVLLEYQWEQTKGAVSFAGCIDPQAFLWTKPSHPSPGLQGARTRGLLCESTEPSLLSQLPRSMETGPAMKLVEPSANEKTRVLCSKSIEHVTMAAAKR